MPISIDNSILTCMAVCDTRTLLRHVLGYSNQEELAILKSGTAGHEALAVYFKSGGNVAASMDMFDSIYRDWALANVPNDDRLSWANCHAILKIWFERHKLRDLPFIVDPNHVEIGFSFPLDASGNYVFVGRIDAIVEDKLTGRLRILDHKFTGRINPRFVERFRTDTQFSGYIWAGQQQLSTTIDGGYVNAIELSRLPSTPDRVCKTHAVPYDECGFMHANYQLLTVQRTPIRLENWRRNALALAKEYEVLLTKFADPAYLQVVRTQGEFLYGECYNCLAKDFCYAGRPVEHLDSLFVRNPWVPFEHAFGEE